MGYRKEDSIFVVKVLYEHFFPSVFPQRLFLSKDLTFALLRLYILEV